MTNLINVELIEEVEVIIILLSTVLSLRGHKNLMLLATTLGLMSLAYLHMH